MNLAEMAVEYIKAKRRALDIKNLRNECFCEEETFELLPCRDYDPPIPRNEWCDECKAWDVFHADYKRAAYEASKKWQGITKALRKGSNGLNQHEEEAKETPQVPDGGHARGMDSRRVEPVGQEGVWLPVE